MRYITLVFVALACLLLQACTQKEEDCTNPAAVNFNAAAEIDCCCQLPQIRLRFSHVLDSVTLSEGFIAQDNFGTFIQLDQVSFLASNVRLRDLLDPSLDDTQTLDEVDLIESSGNTLTLANDFGLIHPGIFQLDIGQPDKLDRTDLLLIDIGTTAQVAAASAPSNHVLNTSRLRDSLGQLLTLNMRVTIDTNFDSIPDTQHSFTLEASTNLASFSIPFTDGIQQQEHTNVDMNIQYHELLSTIDFLNDSYSIQKTKLITNLNTSSQFIIPTP